jgi:hypothetical protein
MLKLISGVILIYVLYGAVSVWHVFNSHRFSVQGDTVLLL